MYHIYLVLGVLPIPNRLLFPLLIAVFFEYWFIKCRIVEYPAWKVNYEVIKIQHNFSNYLEYNSRELSPQCLYRRKTYTEGG